jgi:hypothetical protein
MVPFATLRGHTLRVLYMALSPDGTTVVTGAGDETLRFWEVFPATPRMSCCCCFELWWWFVLLIWVFGVQRMPVNQLAHWTKARTCSGET